MCTERIVDLVDEGYDLAIRMTKTPDQELIARRLARCCHIVAASPDYLAKNSVPQVPEDLKQHRCVVFSYHTTSVWPFAKDDGDYSVKVPAALKTNNPDVLLESTISGMGITLMPTFLASDAIRSGKLRLVLQDYQTIDLDIYVVYASRHHLPVKIRVFIDYLKERITDPPYWDDCLSMPV
jgi:DNA-binding transcriptional LysR family regulator